MLYVANKAPKIIVSGGFDEDVKKYESLVMYEYLLTLGVSKDDIIIDCNGDNTYSTLKRTKEFIGDKSIIFCTQEIYSYRAVYIANHLDLKMNVFCSDPVIYSHLLKINIRESLARVKAFGDCKFFSPNYNSISKYKFIEGDMN